MEIFKKNNPNTKQQLDIKHVANQIAIHWPELRHKSVLPQVVHSLHLKSFDPYNEKQKILILDEITKQIINTTQIKKVSLMCDNDYQLFQLLFGSRYHTDCSILAECQRQTNCYINGIQRNLNNVIPAEIRYLCFQYCYVNEITAKRDIDSLIRQLEDMQSSYTNFECIHDTESEHIAQLMETKLKTPILFQILSHTILYVHRTDTFSVLDYDQLLDVNYWDNYRQKQVNVIPTILTTKYNIFDILEGYKQMAIQFKMDMTRIKTCNVSPNDFDNPIIRDIFNQLKLIAFQNINCGEICQFDDFKKRVYSETILKCNKILSNVPTNGNILIIRAKSYRKIKKYSLTMRDLLEAKKHVTDLTPYYAKWLQEEFELLHKDMFNTWSCVSQWLGKGTNLKN